MKNKRKLGPVIMLAVLTIFATFVSGVKYAEYINQINQETTKSIIANSKNVAEPKDKPVNKQDFFKKFSDCGFSFFYDMNLKIVRNIPNQKNQPINRQDDQILVLCDASTSAQIISNFEASGPAKIDDKRVTVYTNKTNDVSGILLNKKQTGVEALILTDKKILDSIKEYLKFNE
jgi:hypothetical protein